MIKKSFINFVNTILQQKVLIADFVLLIFEGIKIADISRNKFFV